MRGGVDMDEKRPMRVRLKMEKIITAMQFTVKHQPGIDTYRLMKVLLFADKSHLKQYGRPVTFDHYVAMLDGPVPSRAYDLAKTPGRFWAFEHDSDNPRIIRFLRNLQEVDLEQLSESDKDELDVAIGVINQLATCGRIKAASHDPVFEAAWASRGDRRSTAIAMEDWIAADNDKAKDDIIYRISMA